MSTITLQNPRGKFINFNFFLKPMYDTTKPYKAEVLSLIKETWHTDYVKVVDGIVEKRFSFPEYHHTDGIGTKGVYHWRMKTLRNAVLDALAMNLNDLAFIRAVPYALIDHIILPEDDRSAILEIIRHMSDECKKRDIAITGGETAVHDNAEGLEIGITMLGFIKHPKENRLKAGDLLIGIESNGIHSNGFTLIRKIFGKEEIKKEFTEPTEIYIDTILRLNEKFDIHGMMHITGGAFTKLKDILVGDAIIERDHKLEPHKIFWEIHERGISDEEMYKTFNNGIGFILGIEEEFAEDILSELKEFKADIIGRVVKGRGRVIIKSKFSDKIVTY